MKLAVISEYRNAREHYLPGQVLDVTEAQADWLMRDAPGCFEIPAPEAEVEKALDVPPAAKMVAGAPKRK